MNSPCVPICPLHSVHSSFMLREIEKDCADHPWNTSNLVTAVVLSICFFLGVSGNIAVLILKPNWQNMSSLSQSLMLNLAISDLLSLLTLPLWIYAFLFGWKFDLVPCKLLAYVVYCSIYASLLTVSGLSIQRYLVVVRQRRCHQVKRRALLFTLWLVASILAIPALVVQNLQTDQQWIICKGQYSSDAQWVAVLLTETVFGFICFILVAFSYVCLQKRVNHNFVLWSPLHTINVLALGAICFKNNSLLESCVNIWDIVKAIAFLNNCINPLLYAFNFHKMCRVCNQEELTQPSQTLDIKNIGLFLKSPSDNL
uniref:G-protein coupled receptors family 1 profile domain-containing protein n=1 Tax=Xiphophorus couchianus TaxID=32473 RepID=A0A3B5LJY2_9TELE